MKTVCRFAVVVSLLVLAVSCKKLEKSNQTPTSPGTTWSGETQTSTGTSTGKQGTIDAAVPTKIVTCGYAEEGGSFELSCMNGQVITSIVKAVYGNPDNTCQSIDAGTVINFHGGSGDGGDDTADAFGDASRDTFYDARFVLDTKAVDVMTSDTSRDVGILDAPVSNPQKIKCTATRSMGVASAMCLGKSSCQITATKEFFGEDPCPTIKKSASISVTCGENTYPKCGTEFEVPCGLKLPYDPYGVANQTDGLQTLSCDNGLRLDYIRVKTTVVQGSKTVETVNFAVPWCVPCNLGIYNIPKADASGTCYPYDCERYGFPVSKYSKCCMSSYDRGPAKTEACDGYDNNCNGLADEGSTISSCQVKSATSYCYATRSSTSIDDEGMLVGACSACRKVCDPQGKCGASDGCGGSCTGSCTGVNDLCQATSNTFACNCVGTCVGKSCGEDNGCGIRCGNGPCPTGGTCQSLVSSASGYVCRDASSCMAGQVCGTVNADGYSCTGTCTFGVCTYNQSTRKHSCVCTPVCTAKKCGEDNGCGGVCSTGTCATGLTCSAGICKCIPSCTGKACGASDGCGGICSTGSCPTGQTCTAGACKCIPNCTGKTCGDNGCGGSCGSCTNPLHTCVSGACKQTLCYNINGPCTKDSDCCDMECCVVGTYKNMCNCASAH